MINSTRIDVLSKARRNLEREAASFIIGENKDIELIGNPEQIQAMESVLHASRVLYSSLKLNAPLQEIRNHIDAKKHAAVNFKSVFGFIWPF